MVTLVVVAVATVGVLTALSHASDSAQLAAKSGARIRLALALALARARLWETVLLAQLELTRVIDELEGAHVDVLELASCAARLGRASDASRATGLRARVVVLVAMVDTLRPHSWWSQAGLNGVSEG